MVLIFKMKYNGVIDASFAFKCHIEGTNQLAANCSIRSVKNGFSAYDIGLYYIYIQYLWGTLMTPLNEFIQIPQVIGSSVVHIPKANIRSASSIQRGIQQPPKLLSVFRISKVK